MTVGGGTSLTETSLAQARELLAAGQPKPKKPSAKARK